MSIVIPGALSGRVPLLSGSHPQIAGPPGFSVVLGGSDYGLNVRAKINLSFLILLMPGILSQENRK